MVRAEYDDGRIIKYETYLCNVRISLKDMNIGSSVTVGVCEAFVHTAYLDSSEVPAKYEYMKHELSEFLDKDTVDNEEIKFYRQFADKY